MSKHTPGPLSVANSRWTKCKYIVAGKRVIATVHGNASEDYQANTELFASAPELAECLRGCVESLEAFKIHYSPLGRARKLLERLGM